MPIVFLLFHFILNYKRREGLSIKRDYIIKCLLTRRLIIDYTKLLQ